MTKKERQSIIVYGLQLRKDVKVESYSYSKFLDLLKSLNDNSLTSDFFQQSLGIDSQLCEQKQGENNETI